MLHRGSFWQNLLSFLVFILLPFSALASKGVVPIFLLFSLSFIGYFLTHQPHINFKDIFHSFKTTPCFTILGLFLLWGIISIIWSIDGKYTLYSWIKLLSLSLAGMILILLPQKVSKSFKNRLLLALMVGLVLTNAWLMIEIKTQGKLLFLIKGKDFNLTHYNKSLSLGSMLFWPIMIYLNRFFKENFDQEKKYLIFLLQLILIFQTAFVIFCLEATTVKIAFIIGLLVAIFSLINEKFVKWSLLLVSIAIFITSPLLYQKVLTPQVVASVSHNFIKKPSFYHRLYIWNFVSGEALLKPWTGWGLNASRHKRFSEIKISAEEIKKKTTFLKIPYLDLLPLHPHNLPLQLWLELGFPGVFLITYLISLIILMIPQIFKDNFSRSAAYAIFSSALTMSLGSYGTWQSWWVSGLWLSIIFMRFLENRNE